MMGDVVAAPTRTSDAWRHSPHYSHADAAGHAVLAALEAQCAGLRLLDTPVWVFDCERCQCLWANPAGLRVWRAETVEELQTRNFAATQSEAIYTLLNDYLARVRHGEAIATWVTLEPQGTTLRTYQTHHHLVLADGRDTLLIEARILPPAEELVAFAADHSLTVGLYELDGTFVSANNAFLSISRHGALEDLTAFLAANGVGPTWSETLERSYVLTFEANIATERGLRRFQCELRRVLTRSNRVRAILSLFDLTDQRLDEAEASKLAADSDNRAKSQFLATMSHEIRTPMNAIIGLSRLCLQTELNPKQRQYVAGVHKSATGLLTIINDILDFSKMEAGKLVLEERHFGLSAVLDTLDSTVGYLARDKGLRFETTLAADAPPFLLGDPGRLGQVLLNLTGNAVKFTPSGTVRVAIDVLDMDDDRVRLAFRVQDTGIGLSQEEQGRLFSAFSQVDASTTRKYGGTGLGLVISKQLVALLGGELWVESTPGRGSTFQFTAMFRRGALDGSGDRHPDEDRDLAHAKSRLRGARVLVAEDNDFNQQVIEEVLADAGMSVTVCGDGAAAVQTLQRGTFDFVLMDVQMPVMDGYEATRQIRATPSMAGVRIIAMTANAMGEDRARCLEAGMDDFATKPIDADGLLVLLAKWLPETPTPASAPPPPTTPPLDLSVLDTTLGGNTQKVARFARRFVELILASTPDLERAHYHQDGAALAAYGHKHKAAAASAGAMELASLLAGLEDAARRGDWQEVDGLVARVGQEIARVVAWVGREMG